MQLPKPAWWRDASRKDLALLGRALRGGWVPEADRPAIFAAVREQAAEKGGRFARAAERLLAEFSPPANTR
jgi:hypothetical protein